MDGPIPRWTILQKPLYMVRADRRTGVLYNERGQAYEALGSKNAAIQDYRMALAYDSTLPGPKERLQAIWPQALNQSPPCIPGETGGVFFGSALGCDSIPAPFISEMARRPATSRQSCGRILDLYAVGNSEAAEARRKTVWLGAWTAAAGPLERNAHLQFLNDPPRLGTTAPPQPRPHIDR